MAVKAALIKETNIHLKLLWRQMFMTRSGNSSTRHQRRNEQMLTTHAGIATARPRQQQGSETMVKCVNNQNVDVFSDPVLIIRNHPFNLVAIALATHTQIQFSELNLNLI